MDRVGSRPISGKILDSVGKTRVHRDPWTNPGPQTANVLPKVGCNTADWWIRVGWGIRPLDESMSSGAAELGTTSFEPLLMRIRCANFQRGWVSRIGGIEGRPISGIMSDYCWIRMEGRVSTVIPRANSGP